MKCVPICPECGEEFARQEWVEELGGRTGFCHPCAKHFELCHSSFYMDSCVRSHEHYGHHITKDGNEFVDEGKTYPYRVAPTLNRTVFDYKIINETVSASQLAKEQPTGKFVVSEEIGKAVVNPRGVANGDKSTIS